MVENVRLSISACQRRLTEYSTTRDIGFGGIESTAWGAIKEFGVPVLVFKPQIKEMGKRKGYGMSETHFLFSIQIGGDQIGSKVPISTKTSCEWGTGVG
jgi:hypothetical protein